MLLLENIAKKFGPAQVLNNINLCVNSSSRTAIVGPSGSGKTTLLRLIAGFEIPDSGRIILNDRPLFAGYHFVPPHQRKIGFVPQEGALFPHLSVAKNIAWGLRGSSKEIQMQVAALMERVALDHNLAKRWPHEISGGQQQRVALARALAQKPALMLLDEPFSALDAGLRNATRKATAELLTAAGVASILVTHDQNEALSFATQIAVISQGRFAQVGRPIDVYSRPVDQETALFLGDAILLSGHIRDGKVCTALGEIEVPDALADGGHTIMLRPEQLRIEPCHGRHPDAVATIIHSDFSGFYSTLTLRVNASDQTITVKVVTHADLQPGMRVKVVTSGPAVIVN